MEKKQTMQNVIKALCFTAGLVLGICIKGESDAQWFLYLNVTVIFLLERYELRERRKAKGGEMP